MVNKIQAILIALKRWIVRLYHKVEFAFLVYAKDHEEYIVIPENFDLDKHLQDYPPELNEFNSKLRFSKDKVFLIFHLLSSIPARNTDLINDDGYVNICMNRFNQYGVRQNQGLRDSIKDIDQYFRYLISTGVIECDNIYIPKIKCLGYRWSRQYENQKFISIKVPCRHADNVYDYKAKNIHLVEEYVYLFHWYDQSKLSIDDRAIAAAWEQKEYKMAHPENWSVNKDTNRKKHPELQYKAAIRNITKIQNHQYEPHIDENIHRLHTVLTNLQKDYRNYITYDNQPLAAIDITNSQPFLACLILNPEFWDENSTLPISFNTLPDNIKLLYTIPKDLPIMIGNFFKRTNSDCFQKYKEDVLSSIYEIIASEADKLNPENAPMTRNEAKTLMFYMLFSSNRGGRIPLKRLFEKHLYPEVAEFFRIVKTSFKEVPIEKQHNRLSCTLQAIESEIILHKCCKRIWIEKEKSVPIFTIHDSIVTTQENVEYVYDVMMSELISCIGVAPTLHIEEWTV